MPAGKYILEKPIVINRSNLTIQGGGSTNSQTLLVRGQNMVCPMIMVGDVPANCIFQDPNGSYGLSSPSPLPPAATNSGTTAYNNITIQNLTICGASTLNQSPSSPCSQYESVETTCGSWTHQVSNWYADVRAFPNSNPNNRPTVPPPFPQCLDLSITNADTGSYSPSPWNTSMPGGSLNTTSYAVTISNVDFEDATGHAISIYPNADAPFDQTANGVYITGSKINTSAITGVLLGSNGGKVGSPTSIDWTDYTQCDNWQGTTAFADDPTVGIPHNIRIEGSSFANNNTGFMGGRARYVGIRNQNVFTNNYISPQAGNYGGGTLELEMCSDQVQIENNTFSGPPVVPPLVLTSGLELYSRNLYVSGNTFSGYVDEGIGALSVLNATITGNHLYKNDTKDEVGDINVATRFPGGACDAYRNVSGLNVQSNDSAQQPASNVQYGVNMAGGGEGSTNMIDLLNNNTFSSGFISATSLAYETAPIFLEQRVSLTQPNLLSPATQPTLTSPTPGPQTIAVFPQCAQPLGFPTPQTHHQFLRFGANDPLGPGNVTDIQGFLGTAQPQPPGPSLTYSPSGVVTSYQCHFYYQPPSPANPTGLIWLDDNNDDYHWVNQNLIGMPIGMNGGYNLSNNSACTIHGATSSVTTGTYDVVLVLDIEFLQTGTWYMYESVQNNQGKVNPSQSGGNPPWSYWGYWPVS